jgi:hypothetical protein
VTKRLCGALAPSESPGVRGAEAAVVAESRVAGGRNLRAGGTREGLWKQQFSRQARCTSYGSLETLRAVSRPISARQPADHRRLPPFPRTAAICNPHNAPQPSGPPPRTLRAPRSDWVSTQCSTIARSHRSALPFAQQYGNFRETFNSHKPPRLCKVCAAERGLMRKSGSGERKLSPVPTGDRTSSPPQPVITICAV